MEVRKIAIDNSTLSVLAVGVALFALAFGAFTHLSGRIESLDAKFDARIDKLDAKIEQQAARTDARIDRLDAKIEKVSSELNAKIDRVDAKIDAVNARLDRLFEVIASPGRRES
ncbi:hypothetical protein AXK12_01785 [Cephaloticoccus capnophilus]|uniref:Uncharacterized protein n=1 Tax=Cephaloticoccus capnophilus TaxID=1548208 RepID=A0A139SSG0_9BACT|nr:hypothetical protein AXK12_01785 [Cephaloticoccus capnophilus]